TRDARSDFRVVAATNENLIAASARGAFRADLRHRLSGVVIAVPSLASRAEDIPELAQHFLQHSSLPNDERRIDQAATKLLMSLPWTGNVRELKLVIETAAAFARGIVDVAAIEIALDHRPMEKTPPTLDDGRPARQDLIIALHDAAWDV